MKKKHQLPWSTSLLTSISIMKGHQTVYRIVFMCIFAPLIHLRLKEPSSFPIEQKKYWTRKKKVLATTRKTDRYPQEEGWRLTTGTIFGLGTNHISAQLFESFDLLIIKFILIYMRREYAQERKFDLRKIPTTNIMQMDRHLLWP